MEDVIELVAAAITESGQKTPRDQAIAALMALYVADWDEPEDLLRLLSRVVVENLKFTPQTTPFLEHAKPSSSAS